MSLKVLLENLLRHEDGRSVSVDDVKAVTGWLENRRSDREIAFRPARVLMQDFTGVPAVVDLAAMREAMVKMGGDPTKINPLSPVDLVIDHSVMVDHFAGPDAVERNMALEFERNGERYAFLRWGQTAFDNFRVVPPGTGICHQVNLEYLAQVVWTGDADGTQIAYPDTLVGTDSHTTMVNGLAVLGWGGGGIEAEGGDARPADFHADPRGDRFRTARQAQGRDHRDRPGVDGDADAARQGRRRQIRRVLRRWPGRAQPRRPGRPSPTWRRNTAPPAAISRSTAKPSAT